MDNVNRAVLRELLERVDGLYTSIYMPTHRGGADVRQDPIRLKNLIRQADDDLQARGLRRSDSDRLLDPARRLLDDAEFWQHQGDGLAVFAGPDFFRRYRVPLAFEPVVIVSERPHIKPLLPLFAEDGQFFVLALSQNAVRLLGCTRYTVRPIALEGVPGSLAEAMQATVQERHIQFHTGTSVRAGDRAAMFHSQGTGTDDAVKKKNVQEYLRLVCRGVEKTLGEARLPLVLAGADFVRAFYREASSYSRLLGEGISGNPDRMAPQELRDLAWPIIEPATQQARRDALALYEQAAGTGLAGDKLEEIVPAAYQGRVALLLIDPNVHCWGRYDPATDRVDLNASRQAGDQDLLDLAAVHTLLHSGRVFAIPPESCPGAGPVAAVFRSPGLPAEARPASY